MILYMYQKEFQTWIIEETQTYISQNDCKHILDELCNLYGSSMEGRKSAISKTLMIVQMLPILISEVTHDLFFPIVNGMHGTWWINYKAMKNMNKMQDGNNTIIFKNGDEINIQCDARSLIRQMRRCELYLKVLSKANAEDYLQYYKKR